MDKHSDRGQTVKFSVLSERQGGGGYRGLTYSLRGFLDSYGSCVPTSHYRVVPKSLLVKLVWGLNADSMTQYFGLSSLNSNTLSFILYTF